MGQQGQWQRQREREGRQRGVSATAWSWNVSLLFVCGVVVGGLSPAGAQGPRDVACVSVFPRLCKYVDELPVPRTIDMSAGGLLNMGAFKIKQVKKNQPQ